MTHFKQDGKTAGLFLLKSGDFNSKMRSTKVD